ncbi:MAG: hypothetical protein AMK73_05860 [Planctomycetes bacterium SM23_32]|nr:MAG: hypothetical protein AMK73_05860 [Planctomycetes bacterium SM23_32]
MNPTQTIAWLVCLIAAFFAAVLAVKNSYGVALLEKQYPRVQEVVAAQTELLTEIRDVLQQIEADMRAELPAPAAPGLPAQGAPTEAD